MSYTTPFYTSCVGVRWKMCTAYRAVSLCSNVSMFNHTYVSPCLCSTTSVGVPLRFSVHMCLCSIKDMFYHVCNPQCLSSTVSMFCHVYVLPRLCSTTSMFYHVYVLPRLCATASAFHQVLCSSVFRFHHTFSSPSPWTFHVSTPLVQF